MTMFRLLSATIALVLGSAGFATAGVLVEVNRIGYSGTWTQYSTLNDALNGTNPGVSGVTPQRDGVIGVYQGISAGPNAGPDYAAIVTRFSDPAIGNPNNTVLGFLQYVNNTNPNSNIAGLWLNEARTAFGVSFSGATSTPLPLPTPDEQRFGYSASDPDLGIGDFLSFNLNAIFTGVTPTGFDPNIGFTGSGFTGVSGSVTGIFQQGSNFYSFNLLLNGTVTAPPTAEYANFASSQVIPEPATLAVVGLFSLAGIAVRVRRKRTST